MKSYALIFLAIVSANAIQWEGIQRTGDILKGYQNASDDVINSVKVLLNRTSEEISQFLSSLDDLAVVKEVKFMPDSDCKKEFTDLNYLKKSFKVQYNNMEGPIIKRISDIKGRFSDIWGTLAIYQGLADGKWWACQIDGKECTNQTQIWLEQNIQSLFCKLVPDCGIKVIKKREVSSTISCGKSAYPFNIYGRMECVNIDSSNTCNGYCSYDGCKDEPSSDCSKYCVDGYHCLNLKCIDKIKVCDGTDDCGDGSDERNCMRNNMRDIPLANCTLETGNYLCSDKRKCIELQRSCDGHADCTDGSDEGAQCSDTDCGSGCLAAGGVCLSTARGGICLSHCPPGTHETPEGCRAGPALPPTTLAELLEDTPRLASRYLAGVKLLQSRVVDDLAASLSRVTKCMDGKTSFDSILLLSDFLTTTKPPFTTTKHPFTTTKHPFTTTKHPITTTKHHTTTHETTEDYSY